MPATPEPLDPDEAARAELEAQQRFEAQRQQELDRQRQQELDFQHQLDADYRDRQQQEDDRREQQRQDDLQYEQYLEAQRREDQRRDDNQREEQREDDRRKAERKKMPPYMERRLNYEENRVPIVSEPTESQRTYSLSQHDRYTIETGHEIDQLRQEADRANFKGSITRQADAWYQDLERLEQYATQKEADGWQSDPEKRSLAQRIAEIRDQKQEIVQGFDRHANNTPHDLDRKVIKLHESSFERDRRLETAREKLAAIRTQYGIDPLQSSDRTNSRGLDR